MGTTCRPKLPHASASAPLEDGDDVGEVVCPDVAARVAVECVPVRIVCQVVQVFGAAGHDDPLGGFFAFGLLIGLCVVAGDAGERAAACEVGDDGVQVEAAVGDVKDDETVGREVCEVEVERLRGHQVDGNRVGAKGVEDNETVSIRGRAGKLQARVAECDGDGRVRAVDQVGEVFGRACDADNFGVDLVESPA